MKNEKAKVKVIPLGGVNEIGKNLTAIEYKNDIVVIDCGLKFPDEDMFGIDLVPYTGTFNCFKTYGNAPI